MFYIIVIGLLFVDVIIIPRILSNKRILRKVKRLSKVVLTALYLILACVYYNKYSITEKEYEIITELKLDTIYTHTDYYYCCGTYYNPVVEQCDSNPFVTASCSFIDTIKLNNGDLRWVAVSQDLLKRNGGPFSFHDTIIVECNTNEYINGEWIVEDCMNERFNYYIDFLMPVNDSKNIGKRSIRIHKK